MASSRGPAVGIPVPKPGSCYFQKTPSVTPVTRELLSRTVEDGNQPLVVVVPHRALSRGRTHLLDFKRDSFAQPYRFFVMVLLAAAHVCKSSQLMVSYAPRADLDPRSDDGIYYVLYPKKRTGVAARRDNDEHADDPDGPVDDDALNAHTAQRLAPSEWIRRRLLAKPLAQLAELAQAGAPRPPPKPAAVVPVGDVVAEDAGGGVAVDGEDAAQPAGRARDKPRRGAQQPTLSPQEQVTWSVFAPIAVQGYAQTIARQYGGVSGGRQFASDGDAVEEVLRVETAVMVKRDVCSESPQMTFEEEVRCHDPAYTGWFTPVHPSLTYLYRRGLTYPTVFSSFRLPHVAPYVDVNDPGFQAWYNQTVKSAAREDPPRHVTFAAALAQWTAEYATAMATDPPPLIDWVKMMKRRYESGLETRQSLNTIFWDTLPSYLNPENQTIGNAARAVADWTERNLGSGAYAASRFVITKVGDNMHTAYTRFVQAVMNHGVGLSGTHALFRMLEIAGMERMAFDPMGGSTYIVVHGAPGTGKSRIVNLYTGGCPDGMMGQVAHMSTLARTGKEEHYGKFDAVDELSSGDLGYKPGQATDPYSVTKLALDGGQADCSGGTNETRTGLMKMAVGGVVDYRTEHMTIIDGERVMQTTRTIQTGVTVANTNSILPAAPALRDRFVRVVSIEDHKERRAFEAALSGDSMCSALLYNQWKQINLRRIAFFQLLHVAKAAGCIPGVRTVEVNKILRRTIAYMMAMGSPVVSARTALRVARYIEHAAMDSAILKFGKFRNPTQSHSLSSVLPEVMALASPTWATIISMVTEPCLRLGPDPVEELIIAALRQRFFMSKSSHNALTTGLVRSSPIYWLKGLSPAKFVRALCDAIAPGLPGLTRAQICYHLAEMTTDTLSNPIDDGRRVAMMPRAETAPPYIELQRLYMANERGPACDAVTSCVPQREEPQNVFTSYISPNGAYYQVRIPRNDNMVQGENGEMSNPLLDDRYNQLGEELEAARAEMDAAEARLHRHVWYNARLRSNNMVATDGDRQRSREATAAKRRDEARYYSNRGLGADAMLQDGAPQQGGDHELGDDLREPDEQLDGADVFLAYASNKDAITAEIEELRNKMGLIRMQRATMAIAHPVALSRGLVQPAPSIRDPSQSDREFASMLGVSLPEARARFEQITVTDADMSEAQLKHCGFTQEQVERHAGYAPNTRSLMFHLCHVDRAFHVLCAQSKSALEAAAKAAAEADAQVLPGMREHLEELERRRLSAEVVGWARAMVELARSIRAWERARSGLIGADGPFDDGWARFWTETHFLPAPPPLSGTVVIQSVATFVYLSVKGRMDAVVQAAIGCSNLMGFVGLPSQTTQAALRAAFNGGQAPVAPAAPVAGVRRPAPEPDPEHESVHASEHDAAMQIDNGSRSSDSSDSDDIDSSSGNDSDSEPRAKRSRTEVSQ